MKTTTRSPAGKARDDMNDEDIAFFESLSREADEYMSGKGEDELPPVRSWLVADFEFRWDRAGYESYRAAEGQSASPKIRWPFDRIAAASWMILRFRRGEAVPEIEPPVVMTIEQSSEREMAEALFMALSAEPEAVLTSWGGEVRDFAVLRRCAASHELLLPPQLRDGSPYSRQRLDLCRATSVAADCVHLPELAMAMGIPAKPSPSRCIGKLVEQEQWPAVREQVLADVLTTSALCVGHLEAHGHIACNRADTMVAMAGAAALAAPDSMFLARSFAPWARQAKIRSGLRGLITAA
jgi:hypothetical protein